MTSQSERGDAGENLEAGHVFPQRAELLPPLHHPTQQAAQNIRKRGHHLLHQVRDIVEIVSVLDLVSVLIVLHHLLSAFQFISFGDYFWHSFYKEF